jgi:CRISPR/Cas system-associated exonuclease Cas4 (RecB family)
VDIPPERWPNYEITRARLVRVFTQIAALVAEAGGGSEILAEHSLTAANGRIHGRADLIVRSPRLHVIVDYKTGSVTDHEGQPLADYAAQLLLYAYMEHDRTGSFPSAGYLMPFDDAAIRMEVDATSAKEAGRAAIAELDQFNERALTGAEQPARPAPETCRFCPFSIVCAPFWNYCNASWGGRLLAARGTIVRIARGQLPLVNLEVQVVRGSVAESSLVIRQAALSDFPVLADADSGDEIAIVGLVPEPERGTYRIRPSGRLWIGSPRRTSP